MKLSHRISSLLRNLFRRPPVDDDLKDEVNSYLEMMIEKKVEQGITPAESRRLSLLEFGGAEQVKEKVREVSMGHYLETIFQDLRYGVRMLAKSPVFTAAAVLSLALGIGANTAIFSLIDEVLLKTLPVDHPEQLFFISNVGRQGGGGAPPYPCFERFRDNTHFLSGIAASSPANPKVEIAGQIEEIKGQFVSGNYFSLLGVNAIIGRTFTPKDDSLADKGGPDGPVAVIGYNYWKRRFAADPSVIGKVITIDKNSVTIVGVTQPEFRGMKPGSETDINLPIMLAGHEILADRGSWWFGAVGRLKSDASPEQARAELNAIFQGFMDESGSLPPPEIRKDYFDHIQLDPAGKGEDLLRLNYSKPLRILMFVVALVLLIACANVANLLLARATARRREFAVRLAIGASRGRIIRQTLTESALLVSLGGALGLLLAHWSGALLVNLLSTGRQQVVLDLRLNARVLFFTLGLSLLTGIIFSLAPAIRSTRIDPGPELKDNGATSSNNRSRSRLGKFLVAGQVALSLLLLVDAGLFLRTLQNLKSVDAGFRPDGVLTMSVDPGTRGYKRPQLLNFWQDTLERIKRLPNIRTVSLSTLTPLDGRGRGVMVDVPGFLAKTEREKEISLNHVSPDYFDTFGISILNGRTFNDRDTDSALKVCILNEKAARLYFGDRNPIGAKVGFARPMNQPSYEVVGVVKDAKYAGPREEVERKLYLPVTQGIDGLASMTLAMRTDGNPSVLASSVRNEIRSIGSDILVTKVLTLDERVNQTLILERLVSSLSNVFGLLALVLTCIGLYGVMSYEVARRTHEIGIRLAIGANTRDVIRMVMQETMLMILIGVGLGLVVALVSTHYISSLLFGLTPNDPLTIASAVFLLTAIAALAGYLPARRAARVDPMVALRYE